MKKNTRKSKQPNSRKPSSRPREREENEMLSEFSDDYNEFYVDEVALSRRRESEERNTRSADAKTARRKPVSPLKRKIIRITGTVAIVGVILVVGVILSLTVLFKTASYELTGNTLYYDADIIETCGIREGENIFLAPKGAAAKRIVDHFPYVEDARVSFRIPDTIQIKITEAVEGYLYKISDTEYLVISTKGRVLNRVADKSSYKLPVFIGPELKSGEIGQQVVYADDEVMDIISDITRVFSDNGYQDITEINAANTSAITFTYDGRIKVKLGIPEDLSYKIRTAMTVIDDSIDVASTSRIQGTLDVSRCNQTKRAYFREGDITPTEAPTEPASTASTEPTAAPTESEVWTDDDWSDDWSDDAYTWDESEWD